MQTVNTATAQPNPKPTIDPNQLAEVAQWLRSDEERRERAMALFEAMRPFIRKRRRGPMVRYV